MDKKKKKVPRNFFRHARQMLEHAIEYGEIPVGRMSTGGLIHLKNEVVYYEFFLKKTDYPTEAKE